MRLPATTVMACCILSGACAVARAPQSSDVSSIEAIVAASLESLSGPVGAPRQWPRYLSLLDPHARLVSVTFDPKAGTPKTNRMSRDEYVRYANDYLVSAGFVDRKLGCVTSRYGNVATARCGFEGLEQARRVERGVAIYQLYFDGKRWWILSVVWDQERPGNPIPAELLSPVARNDTRPPAPESGRADQNVEATVLALDREWGQAYVNNDIGFVDRILAPDWRGWTDRASSDKASELKDFRAGRNGSLENIIDNADVRVYGDTAVVEARERVRYRDAGGEHWLTWHITDVFVRKVGQWQVVTSHQSTLPNP